jgi:NTE family protein
MDLIPSFSGSAADLLGDQDVFAELDPALCAELARRASRLAIEGGSVLFREGDCSDALFVVVSGALTAATQASDGSTSRIANFFAGETVGEMGVITGDPRAATVTALRDSELLRLASAELLTVMRASPDLAIAFARLLSRRLAGSARRIPGRGQPRSFALVPGPGLADAKALAQTIATRFRAHGPTILVGNGDLATLSPAAFQALETANRHVLYLTDPAVSDWTRVALRQSDEIVLLAGYDASQPAGAVLDCEEARRPGRRRHLVLHGEKRGAASAGHRLALAQFDFLHHLQSEEDERRLVRILTRRAVGVALAGGGARAFAHLGVLRALAEAGIRPDIYVGTSMGAVVAAACAAGWTHEEIVVRLSQAFAASSPLGDVMWPWIALFRGERVKRLLRAAFGALSIEDLRLPFACVTTNLSTATACLHRHGLLVDTLRASVSIPGVFQPVLIDGHVHVDGAVVDNLPAAALRGLDAGPVIALDIGQPRREEGPSIPGLVDVLWRTSTITGVASEESYRRVADLYFCARVGDYRLLDWKGFTRAITLGYQEARAYLEANSAALDVLRAAEGTP